MIRVKFLSSDHEFVLLIKSLSVVYKAKMGWWKQVYLTGYYSMKDVNGYHYVPELDSLIASAADHFDSVGLHVNRHDEYNVEFHYAMGPVETPFDIHADNDRGGKFHTCIVYLCSADFDGGEFNIYETAEGGLNQSICVKSPNPSNSVFLLFDGEIHHKPQDINRGERYALIFQLPVAS